MCFNQLKGVPTGLTNAQAFNFIKDGQNSVAAGSVATAAAKPANLLGGAGAAQAKGQTAIGGALPAPDVERRKTLLGQ